MNFNESTVIRELSRMANGNDRRTAILKGRNERSKNRSRRLECVACGTDEYSYRDKADICAHCLLIIWKAEEVTTSEATEDPLIMRVRFPEQSHWFPHPHLQGNRLTVEEGMVFARTRHGRLEDSPGSIAQTLFHEIMTGMSAAFPVAPTDEQGSISFLGGYNGALYARVPRKTFTALLDLWAFLQWLSISAYAEGFDNGKALLHGMLDGSITGDAFQDRVKQQTQAIRERLERATKGEAQHRS